uniref:CCHC-type domain-containing protein n=1 Tax=viral metagenome TaxID=1070528 RepID=A0A6C0HLZ0_9ZZZZ
MDTTTNIYILRLAKGKFYVGKAGDVQRRYAEHLRGKGAEWTRIYRPLNIQTIIYDTSPFDEDRYVKEYMSKFGVDSVRGGSYSQTVLDGAQKSAIEKELRMAEDSCVRCGRAGHFVAACYARTDVDGASLVAKTEPQKRPVSYGFKKLIVSYESDSDDSDDDDSCHRCGREGHWANKCYARWDVDGCEL